MNILGLLCLLLGAHSTASKKTTDDCSAEMDLCFVVDSSRSICYKDPHFRRDVDRTCPNWNALLSFIHSLVARMDIGANAIRVGLVVFDCEASVRWDMKRYRDRKSLMAAIEQLEYTPGQTNISGGLDVSRMFVFDRSRGDRPDVMNAAVIITDGKATDPTAVQPAIGRLHADNVTTYVVGISDAVDEDSLKQLASDPKQKGKTFWTVPDFDQLDQVLDAVQNQVCSDATSTTPSPGSSSFASPSTTRRYTIEKSSALTATTYLTTKTAQPITTTQATVYATTTRLAQTTSDLKTNIKTKTTKTPEPTKTKKTTTAKTTATPEPKTTKTTTVTTTTATPEPKTTKTTKVAKTTATPEPKTTKTTTAATTTATPEPKTTKTTTAATTTTTPEPTTTKKTTTTELVRTTAEPTTVTTELPKCDPSLSCSSQNLTNTVVYEGDSVSFPRINNCQRVQWQLTASSSFYNQPRIITNYDDDVGEAFTDMVAVSGSQLTIFQATVAPIGSLPYSSAGLYTLRYLNPNYTTAANLIVIRSGPLCAADASNPKSTKLNCSIVFAESPVQPNNPIFKWIGSNGNQVKQDQPIPSKIDNYMRRSTSLLPIANTDTATYQCQITFSTAPKSPFAYTDLSSPNFKASCYVSRA